MKIWKMCLLTVGLTLACLGVSQANNSGAGTRNNNPYVKSGGTTRSSTGGKTGKYTKSLTHGGSKSTSLTRSFNRNRTYRGSGVRSTGRTSGSGSRTFVTKGRTLSY